MEEKRMGSGVTKTKNREETVGNRV